MSRRNKISRDKFIQEAERYEEMRDKFGSAKLENFRLIKSHLADWYIAIAAVCFAIGGIAITAGRNVMVHPALFWWGSALLIANGIFIFFARKAEIQSEDFSLLEQKEADLWTMSKIAREHADNNTSRSDEFMAAAHRFVNDYDKRSAGPKWWQWVKFAVHVSLLDVVFGLLLFPILMLASQLPNYPGITFKTYTTLLWSVLVLYLIYTAAQVFKAVKERQRSIAAAQQIKREVDSNRANYEKAAQTTD
jgi:hypothetical protein